MVHAHRLEKKLNEIRDNTPRLENESVESWAKRTWQAALAQLKEDAPELPRVVEARERTARLLKRVGTVELEREEN